MNTTTGFITMIMEWSIIPDDLPFSPLEGLESYNIISTDATIRPGEMIRFGFSRTYTLENFGVGTTSQVVPDGSMSLQAVFTLDENAGGSAIIKDLVPVLEPNARRLSVSS